MPPRIALLLCFCFIASLYFFEFRYKDKSNTSAYLWIPLIWIIIIGSRPISLWISPGIGHLAPESLLEGSPLDRNVFLVLMIAGLCILIKRKINWSSVIIGNLAICIFILYGGVSIFWSDYPYVSVKRWIKSGGHIIMILIILTETDPYEAIKTILKRCSYILMPLSVVFIKYYENIGRSYHPWTGEVSYGGVTTDKNMLGNLCLVCGILFLEDLLVLWKKKDSLIVKIEILINIAFVGMVLWLMIKSDSATSIVSLGIGIFILLLVSILRKSIKYIGIYLLLVVSLFFILQYNFNIVEFSISTLDREITLTGRTDLWKDLVDMETDPWTGTGYESFWLGDRVAKLWQKYWWRPNQAHNGYLEIYLNLGLIGLSIFAVVMLSAYKKIRDTLLVNFNYGRFKLSLLMMAIIYNFTEGAFKEIHLVYFMFLAVAMSAPLKSVLTAEKGKILYGPIRNN